MYLNIDSEDNLAKCASMGEHDPTTPHDFIECPTYSEEEVDE